MIVIVPNTSKHKLSGFDSKQLMYKSDLYIARGMVLKNRTGSQHRVFEPIIEETDDSYIITIHKDKEELL